MPIKGTMMKVELQSISIPVSSSHSEPIPQLAAGKHVGLRVLIVEDHPDTRRTLERLLVKWGHTVAVAEDLASARALLAAQPIDLLLTDLGLPDGHGTDLMIELRAQGIETPGIALSGFGTENDTARSLEAGFAAHFTKPVGTQNLRAEIARIAREITSAAKDG